MKRIAIAISATLLIMVAPIVISSSTSSVGQDRSPIERNPLRQAYFGDLHLHTGFSFDAYVEWGVTVTPDQAYRFARGGPVPYMGQMVRRKDPLDFLAVTDHSEMMGVSLDLRNPDTALYKSDIAKRAREGGTDAFWGLMGLMTGTEKPPNVDIPAITQSAWAKEVAAANKNYVPGKFTTFIAYEWSASPNGNNLHRNVIFRGDTAPFPFSSLDSKRPEDLWTYLETNRKNGIEVLAIPHNSNASNGLMYDWVDSDGKPISEAYAQRRLLNEPVSEVSQSKGTSETTPGLSMTDEMANFEIWPFLLAANTKSKEHGSYIRDAYGRGLEIQSRVNMNPHKFGVVGASDIHSGLDVSREQDYSGNFGEYKSGLASTKRSLAPIREGEKHTIPYLISSPGSLTGAWAESNTREAIFDALRRKECFATSGTRLKLRFFAGWGYADSLIKNTDWVKTAYADGVPMGGDLGARPAAAQAPRFLVWALKDPDGANLDRAQVVKVWLEDGKYREKVFDVAYSGARKIDPKTGKLPPVGNTVDLKAATYQNSIGATSFAAEWQDPEFNPAQAAVYYLRVIEIPTPRWSTFAAVRNHLPLPDGVPATIQERGWSSPIWYTPAKQS